MQLGDHEGYPRLDAQGAVYPPSIMTAKSPGACSGSGGNEGSSTQPPEGGLPSSWFHGGAGPDEIAAMHAVMDALSIGVVIIEVVPDSAPKVIAYNDAYTRMIGAELPLGVPVTALPHAYFLADRVTPVPFGELPGPRALRTGATARDMELHVRRPDGAWRVLLGSAMIAPTASAGAAPRAVLLTRDVTERWRAEEALRSSEARFATLVDKAADALFVHDRAGRFVDVNRRACESLGYTREELLQLGVFDIELDLDRASAQLSWSGARPVPPLTILGRQKRKDGTTFPVEVRVATIELRGERTFMSLVRDITERRQAEERLAAEKERLRVTLSSIGDAVIATDLEGRVTLINEVACALTGWPCEEAIGRPLAEVFTIVNEESRRPIANPVEAVLRERRVVGLANHTALLARDGRERPISDSAAPILDASGQVIGVVLVFRDHSEERRVMNELTRSRAELLAQIERLPMGVIVTRPGKILYANPAFAAILGHADASALIGLDVIDVLAPEDQATARSYRHAAQASGFSLPGREWRLLRRDGRRVTVENAPAQLIEFDGQPATLWAVRDLTELKAVQAQLIQSERLASVGMLAAGVAHEVNNPLTYLIGAIEQLGGTLAEADLPRETREAVAQALAEAREGAARVRQVVRDLKTFSRTDDERRVPVELPRVLDSAISMASNEIRHRARLVKRYADARPVLADEARLGQVFLNLLINAAHAIPEGRVDENEIRVELGIDATGRVIAEIIDTGAGIPSEIIDRIFDPFFTTKPVGVGTGLGLAICRSTIAALGGEVSVDSRPGRGTRFRVALPPAQDAAPVEAPRAPASAEKGRRGRVLVVDDEPFIGNLIRRSLKADHDLTVLTSAREALALFDRGERFDAILCDLMMPDMTGMDLHAALHERFPDQAARMTFLSGGAFTPSATRFLDSVPNARLDKPFDAAVLRATVRGLVG